ncbi:MAG: hypothetical protein IJ831_05190 [Spirochaetales bacterium]|nr:hypothetical protein [Spirochaetales bacterium]
MIEKELDMSLTAVEYKHKEKTSFVEKMLKAESMASPVNVAHQLSEKTPFPALFFDAGRFGR